MSFFDFEDDILEERTEEIIEDGCELLRDNTTSPNAWSSTTYQEWRNGLGMWINYLIFIFWGFDHLLMLLLYSQDLINRSSAYQNTMRNQYNTSPCHQDTSDHGAFALSVNRFHLLKSRLSLWLVFYRSISQSIWLAVIAIPIIFFCENIVFFIQFSIKYEQKQVIKL